MRRPRRREIVVLDADLYRGDVFNDTDEAVVTEIPVEPVSNTYLEQALNTPKPCSGRWIRNASAAVAIILLAAAAQAGDREARRERHHNWIIERQEAYQVQGVPTSRLIIGRREIDIYPNGLMFEKGNVVGVRPTR
jgi:hypothetical protein